MSCAFGQIFLRDQIEKKELGGACRTYRGQKMHKGFWWGELRARHNIKYLDVDGRVILKWVFKKCDAEASTGLIWLRIGTGGRCLSMR